MFPTRTTSTTGTLRVPPTAPHAVPARPAEPQPATATAPGRDARPAWAAAEPEPALAPGAVPTPGPHARTAWAAAPEPARTAPEQPAAAQAGPGLGAPAPAPEGPRSHPAWAAAEPEPVRAVSVPGRAHPEPATAPQAGSGRGTPAGPASRPAPEGPRSHPGWAAELRPAPAFGSATGSAPDAQVRAAWAAGPEPVPGPDPRTASAVLAQGGPGQGAPAPASRTAPEGPRSHPAWTAGEPEPVRTAAPAPAAASRPAWAAGPEPVPGADFARAAVAPSGPGRAAQSAWAAEPEVAASHGSAVAVAVPRPDSGAAAEVPREHPAWEAEALAVASGSFGPAAAAAGAGAVAVAEPRPDAAPAPAAAVGAPREEAGASAPAETSSGWAAAPVARSAQADEPVPPHGWEVPAARAEPESESESGPEPVAAAGPEIPHPQDAQTPAAGVATLSLRTIGSAPEPAPEPAPDAEPELVAAYPGVPGPGAAEIVAQAVARGLEKPPAEGDSEDAPRFGRQRGTSVTEVPVHLPFRGDPRPMPAPAPRTGRSRATPRPAPGRRVPRGDDRLREHRGPVLPGWVGVAVGGIALAGCTAVLWRAGAVPAPFVAAFGAAPRAYHGLRATHWPPLAFLGVVALVALGGLGRARTGHAWVLTLFGRYRGTVRRTGLTWVSPLLLRRRVDVRLRHWRSDPMPAVDSGGLALQVVVQVVWQVKDTARATLAVEDHTEYLAEQVESAMARVLSQLPADAFHEDAPTLRDAEAVGDALTRMLAAETEAVGIEVFSAQPTRIEYAAEVAEAMRRRRVAAIDAKHRDTVLTSVVDAVDDTVHRLTSRGLVELDDYERKALVKDLTVAFYTGRPE
ncbi:SPFH domain-containing protein [Streptomyces sp. NPDC048424]|uniref:SPFH domain-containing protein n=1 Tax=Streptomyces sp. NPDC048424 TaxID=3155265 RepID=UPI00344969C9